MPVFDFSGASASKAEAKCTYTTFHSSHTKPSPEQPIMVLDNKERQWKHHSCGVFTNPVNRTAFDFKEEDGNHTADVLKIDNGFLRDSENEERGMEILESVVLLARKIDMEVIMEGVETKEQLLMLTEMGCRMFQGYYFSRPIPVEEFEGTYM